MKSRRRTNKLFAALSAAGLAAILAVCSVAAFSSVASAADMSYCSHASHDEWTALKADDVSDGYIELSGGGKYYLDEDIDANILVSYKGDVAICLNGHTLAGTGVQTGKSGAAGENSYYCNDSAINVQEGASFYLCDCSEEETGVVTGESCNFGLICVNRAEAYICGGTITEHIETPDLSDDGDLGDAVGGNSNVAGGATVVDGSLYMEGGKIAGNRGSVGGIYLLSDGNGDDAYFEMNGGEISGNTGYYGGAILLHNSGTSVALNGGEISGNVAEFGGGMYISSGGDKAVQITGGKISDNVADYGGGIYATSGKIELQKGEISANKAYKDGGGACVVSKAEFDIYSPSNVRSNYTGSISYNEATCGGGVYAGNGATFCLSLEANGQNYEGVISHNKAVNGGGVYLDDDSAFTTSMSGFNSSSSSGYTRGGLRIEYNEAEECGGGIYGGIEYEAVGAETLYSVNISHNTAAYGGGVYVGEKTSSEPNARYEISENTAEFGGGIYSAGYCQPHCNVLENVATLDGGGVYVKDAAFELNGSSSRHIDSNKAGRNGGGIYLYGDSRFEPVDGSKAEITNNEAAGCGGGIYMQSGSISFSHGMLIEGNKAGECGGGLYIEDGYVSTEKASVVSQSIVAMEIFSNFAKLGGGVYMAGGEMDLSSADISGNTAEAEGAEEGFGGGIYMAGGTLIMYDGSVSENAATSGGGIYASGGSIAISGGAISGNSATSGGGAYIAEGAVTMTGGVISNNSAEEKGGGVYMGVGTFCVQGDSVIAENSTDGGIDENLYLTGDDFITVTGALTEGALLFVAVDYVPSDTNVPMMAVWSDNAYSEGILDHVVSENGYVLHRNEEYMCIELVLIHAVYATMQYGGTPLEILLKDSHGYEVNVKSGYTYYFYKDENENPIDESEILSMTPGGTYYISVHVEASEDYTAFDSDLHELTVIAKDISNAEIVLGDALTYNFEEQTQGIASVTIDGLEVTTYEIVEGTNVGEDAVWKYEDGSYYTDDDGNYVIREYTLKITGTGNFTGTASATFTIARLEIDYNDPWKIERVYSFVYDGEEHSLIVTSFTYGDYKLKEGEDFKVAYTAKTDACNWQYGDINGLGNFCGTIHHYSYKIDARDISDTDYASEVSIEYGSDDESYLTSFVYNGEEQGPAIIKITIHADDLGEKDLYLTEGTDYTLSGNLQKNAGEYELTITGKGNYTGSITVSFTINTLNISGGTVVLGSDLVYSGEKQTQGVAAVYVGDLLIDSSDYEVVNDTATEVGEHTLYIVGTSVNTTGYIVVSYEVYAQNIGDYVIALADDTDEFVYNGSAQGPQIESITVNGSTISDYELSNATAVDVGEYTLTITLGGEYSGNVLHVSYSIVAMNIEGNDNEIIIDWGEQLTYNGESQTQEINGITVNGLNLTFELSDNVQTDAGTYTLTITGTGNFAGTTTAAFKIKAKSIEGADVSLNASRFTYNGEKQTPTISSVVIDGLTATFSSDEGESEGNFGVDAGTYSLVISGIGNFCGETEVTFTIDPLDISAATVEFEDFLTYNRTEQTQNIASVTVGDLTLAEKDYTVSGNTGTNAGSYTMTLTGRGNCTGSVRVNFTISAHSIEGATVELSQNDFAYNGSAQRPEVISVTADGVTLETSEYDVSNSSHTNVGSYTVTVTARGGNFTGTAFATYTISPLFLSDADVYAQDLTYNGEERDVSIAWIRVGDVELGHSDYTITIDGAIKDAGTYTFTVTAASGNFEGSTTSSFEVNPLDISKAEIVLGESLIYNGREQAQQILSVSINGMSFEYEVVEDSNKGTSSGTYTLYIEADDKNFTGTAHTSFTIEKLDISGDDARVEITLESDELTYTGQSQHPAIVSAFVYITVNGNEEEYKLSYTAHYDPQAVDAGTYSITIDADGAVGHTDFTGSVVVKYEIVPRTIEEIEFELEFDEYVYNGAVQSPVVAAVYGVWYENAEDEGAEGGVITIVHRFELDPSTYTVTMPSDAINAGTYRFTVTISEGGNYSAAAPFEECEFTIEKFDISGAAVKMAEHEAFTYNGEVQTQEIESVTVMLNGEEKEIEFNVSGNSTRYAGIHIITITPVDDNNFTGRITRSFTIGRLDISSVTVVDFEAEELTYNGQEQDVPAVSYITITWTENKEGVETEYSLELRSSNYIVSGERQSDAGTYTLTVTGVDNCTGELQLSFEILPLGISEAEIVFGDTLTYNGQEQTITIASITVDGVEVDDYTISGSVVGTDAGDYPLVIEGKGNFRGTFETTFTINPKSIEGADVTIESDHFTYDGTEHALNITVVIDGLEATFALTYYDGDGIEVEAVKAGTYTLVITGTGNFTGSIEETLTIDKAVPEYEEPTGLTAERGYTLSDVVLPEGWAWDAYLDYQFDVSGASYYFWATFTPDDTEDYETVRLRLKVFVSTEEQNDYGASLSIVEYPDKMEYTAFDEFDPDGIVLSIELEDGTSIEVAGSEFEHEVTNGDSLTRDENGQCEIVITYYIPISYIEEMTGGSGISTLAYADNPDEYIALSVVFHVTVNKLTPSVHIEASDLEEGSSGDGSFSFAGILTMSDGEVTYKFYTLVDGDYVEYEGDIYEAPIGTYYIKVFISETNNCEAAESDYYEFSIVEATVPATTDESDSVRTSSVIAAVVSGAVIVIFLIVLIVYLTRKRKY